MKRIAVPAKMARKLYELNADSCCVCKRTGVGLNIHHIDGDSSNTTEENLAVICVVNILLSIIWIYLQKGYMHTKRNGKNLLENVRKMSHRC